MKKLLTMLCVLFLGCVGSAGRFLEDTEDIQLHDSYETPDSHDAPDSSSDPLEETMPDTEDALEDTVDIIEDVDPGEAVDPCETVHCGENAHCVDGECVCNDGYVLSPEYVCVPEDQCAAGTYDCGSGGICVYVGPGEYDCVCSPGYTFAEDGRTCIPWDHCADGTHDCDPHAICRYTGPGTFTCSCEGFYSGDGHFCLFYSFSFYHVFPFTDPMICTDWEAFRAGIPDSSLIDVIEIKGTFDTAGRLCMDSPEKAMIADALRTGITISVTCGGYTWSVANCTPAHNGVEIRAAGDRCICWTGETYYFMMPCQSYGYRGGINTGCNPPVEQTMELIFSLSPGS